MIRDDKWFGVFFGERLFFGYPFGWYWLAVFVVGFACEEFGSCCVGVDELAGWVLGGDVVGDVF